MTTPRDFYLRRYKPTLDAKQDKYEPFRAVITASDGSRTTGNIWKDEEARQVWYQAWGSGSIGWALCDSIEPWIGLGVIIQFNPLIGFHEVMRDDPIQRSSASNRRSYRALTNADFEQGGRFQLWIDPTMILPLSIYPGSSGLTVSIVSGDYIYDNTRKTYTGVIDYDISAEQPAGPAEHNLVGLYLDSSNALNVVTGAAVGTGVTAPEPAWPAGAFRLGVVDMDDTQTTVDILDITNRKVVWTEDNGTLTIALTDLTDVTITGPVADNEILAYDTGTGEWINQTAVELAINLDDLADVDTTGVADGDALIYDTGTSTWIPGASGFNVWPLQGHITKNDDGSDYTDFATALAALAGDEQLIIGQAEFASDNESIPADSSYLGSGDNDWGSVLATSTAAKVITIDATDAGNTYWRDIKFYNSDTGNDSMAVYIVDGGTHEFINCTFQTSGDGGWNAYAFGFETGTYTLTFRDCTFICTGGTTNRGVYILSGIGASTINFIDCRITGATATIDIADSDATINIDGGELTGPLIVSNSTVNLVNVPKITGAITGTPTGVYSDANNKLRRGSSGSLIYAIEASYNANDVYYSLSLSDLDFVATINGAPVGASVVYNAPSSGAEANIKPVATTQLVKMVLHNTTRGNDALISSCDTSTNTITLTANAPVNWANGDTITIRSQTNLQTSGGVYFADFEATGLNVDTQQFVVHLTIRDTGAAGELYNIHPYEAYSSSKSLPWVTQVANVFLTDISSAIPLISSRFTMSWSASGAGTGFIRIKLVEEHKTSQ